MSDLVDCFGLEKGDFVMITGDFRKYFFALKLNKSGVNSLIDEILRRIGSGGTLVFPTFSWDFCHGLNFDAKKTKSKKGGFGNLALKRADFIRTAHRCIRLR